MYVEASSAPWCRHKLKVVLKRQNSARKWTSFESIGPFDRFQIESNYIPVCVLHTRNVGLSVKDELQHLIRMCTYNKYPIDCMHCGNFYSAFMCIFTLCVCVITVRVCDLTRSCSCDLTRSASTLLLQKLWKEIWKSCSASNAARLSVVTQRYTYKRIYGLVLRHEKRL